MTELEQTLDSREVAEMIGKEHKYLMRDIRNYTNILTGAKISPVDFFRENTYKDAKGEERLCYCITKKGCEFIGHKIKGEKGVLFTARYINRFHEMQDILSQKESEPQLPWFIRKFRGKYIMLWRDFEALTGISLNYKNPFWKAHHNELLFGYDYTWWAWHTVIDRKEFIKEYGFDYGDNQCMEYFHMCGVRKALRIINRDRKFSIEQKSYDMIADGLKALEPPKKQIEANKPEPIKITQNYSGELPMQVNIIFGNREMSI